MCEPVACTFVSQWRGMLELLYFASGVLLLVGVGLAYLTYRSARQAATYRNTIDKFASYRNEWDFGKISRVRELIKEGSFTGSDFVSGRLTEQDVQSVRFVLNEWEEIALCVKYKIYSEQLLFEHYGRLGLELWKHLRPFIRHEQKTQSTNWAEFDRLALHWMIRTTSKLQEESLIELKTVTAQLDAVLLKLAR